MLETIYDMLVILLANYYTPENIFQAFQNNFVLPASGDWVTITELDTESMSYPESLQQKIGDTANYNQQTDNIDSTMFQLDFYGINASKCCRATRLYVQSADGTNYLAAAGNVTVHKIEQMRNLTQIWDEKKYLNRFMFRFSLFNNNVIEYEQQGFTTVNPTIILVR